MYIIGSDFNIENIKKYNKFNNNKTHFLSINASVIQSVLNYLKLSQFLNVNYKKINIIMYEIASRIILHQNVKCCFLIIINGIIIHNNGQNLIIYPLNYNYYRDLNFILKNVTKLREVACIIYSVDCYSLTSKVYKNKMVVQNYYFKDNVNNKSLFTTDSTFFLLQQHNLFINKISGEFLLNYANSKCCLTIQRFIDNNKAFTNIN